MNVLGLQTLEPRVADNSALGFSTSSSFVLCCND
ncbi:class III lanthipeptide [Actinophytocola sp.]